LAIDIDPVLTSSFERNFPETKLLLADASTLDAKRIIARAGRDIDGLLGGPPCQAFSEIGRRHPNDPRRDLVRHFFRLVAGLKPKFFLMENVRGLGFERHSRLLQEALELVPKRYVILDPMLLDAADFGAATRRPRLFVLGFDADRMNSLTTEDIAAAKRSPATVRDAIWDMQKARYKGIDKDGFDVWLHDPDAAFSSYAGLLRRNRKFFTGHRRTAHAEETIKRFATVEPGLRDQVGKHARLSWSGQCPTIRAGTGADRGSYQSVRPIHPSEARVITVREAARLQGFPDGFVFHPTVWHSFRMIGNSVSPIIATAILGLIKSRLEEATLETAPEAAR
jgi:DNA (cytosine-5)-methyltransferase 1